MVFKQGARSKRERAPFLVPSSQVLTREISYEPPYQEIQAWPDHRRDLGQ